MPVDAEAEEIEQLAQAGFFVSSADKDYDGDDDGDDDTVALPPHTQCESDVSEECEEE